MSAPLFCSRMATRRDHGKPPERQQVRNRGRSPCCFHRHLRQNVFSSKDVPGPSSFSHRVTACTSGSLEATRNGLLDETRRWPFPRRNQEAPGSTRLSHLPSQQLGSALTSDLLYSPHSLDQQLGIGLGELHKDQEQLQSRLHHEAVLGEEEGNRVCQTSRPSLANGTRGVEMGTFKHANHIHCWGEQEGYTPSASSR